MGRKGVEILRPVIDKLLSNARFYSWLQGLPGFADPKVRIIRTEMPVLENQRILDLGCGPGDRANIFPQDSYLGIDIDHQAIAFAQQKYWGEFRVMDALQLALDDSSFDWVLAGGFFHHLSDADALGALKEARRVLKPSGKMLALAVVWPLSRLNLVGWAIRSLDRGRYIRTNNEFARLFAVHFDIEKIYPFKVLLLDLFAFVLKPKKRGN